MGKKCSLCNCSCSSSELTTFSLNGTKKYLVCKDCKKDLEKLFELAKGDSEEQFVGFYSGFWEDYPKTDCLEYFLHLSDEYHKAHFNINDIVSNADAGSSAIDKDMTEYLYGDREEVDIILSSDKELDDVQTSKTSEYRNLLDKSTENRISSSAPRTEAEYEKADSRYEASLCEPRYDELIFSFDGARGKHIDVYPEKCVISTKVTAGSLLTHNATDGEKTIYYIDCIGIQIKAPKLTLGYIQFETSSSLGNNNRDNFFNENTFTFEQKHVSPEQIDDLINYLKNRIDKIKHDQLSSKLICGFSVADELIKYKQLLDRGDISQSEYDVLKKNAIYGK